MSSSVCRLSAILDLSNFRPVASRLTIVSTLTTLCLLLSPGMQAKAAGAYSPDQAKNGATVFGQSCAQCHGANLEGESGPALSGSTFFKAYGSGTAAPLYDFISRQMPLTAPGSLSQTQYLDVTAYILSRNGIAAGSEPLSSASLDKVSLSGMQTAGASATAATDEIIRAAPPTRTVFAKLPANANVNVTDSMMLNSAADENNWLLHGRTYDNQRYSPLQQITVGNVKSLSLVAVAQTGMTASFETTPIVVNGVMYITTPVVDKKMKIMALNATTGERYWEVTYNLGTFLVCCGPVNRGVAVGYGRVYVVTLDDHLLALDASDGHTVFDKSIVDLRYGYSETLAPQIYDGMIVVGSAGGEWALRGFRCGFRREDR